jgi:hypothetical protein
MYSCMKMEKMRHTETIPGMEGRRDKGEGWRG